MPPVMPRVSTTVSERELKALERIAKKRERPISWVVRKAIQATIARQKIAQRKARTND